MKLPLDSRLFRLAAAGAAGGAALAGGTAAAAWYQLFRRPLPKTKGEVRADGISGPVTIRRDRWGVPHIRAETEEDLFFGQGWCHAQDRLWQMDVYRRVTSGRLSEIAGEAGLPSDRLMRTLGLRRSALVEEERLEPDFRALLDAYCAGLNASAAASSTLPIEFQILRLGFEAWRPVDMLTTSKLLAFGLSTNWEREILWAEMVRELGPEVTARIAPRYPRGNPVVLQPGGAGWSGDGLDLAEQIAAVREAIGLAAEATGSNNWAVSGERTKSGRPLIAGDPHLPTSMPTLWYQVELDLGERYLRGASLPGFPGVFMGENNDVTYTFTNVMADVMDVYVERVDGDSYEFDGEWRPLTTIREDIEVKGREAPEVLRVRWTHHGPIVNDAIGEDPGEPLALSWTAHEYPSVSRSLISGMRPTSGAELVEMLADHNLPVSNLVWADRHGDIGYKLVGRLPIRASDCPDLPKPGWTDEHEWEGVIPYDDLPELVNPDCGYIVTANNQITDDDYPHHITSDYLDGYRARRIEQLIEARPLHDAEGFARMQTDLYSIPGVEVVHRLSRLSPQSQREINAIERLRSWDGNLDTETIAGTIYQAFTLRLAREFCRCVIRDRDLSERYLDRSISRFMEHITSPWRWQSHLMALWEEGDDELIGRSWSGLVLDALRGALDDLEDRFGPDPQDWRWGDVHVLEFPHALGAANPFFSRLFGRKLRAGGGQETVSQIAYDPNDPFTAIWAPSWRLISEPGNRDAGRWQAYGGQSGHVGSGHYDDVQADWQQGVTNPMSGEGPWRELTLVSG